MKSNGHNTVPVAASSVETHYRIADVAKLLHVSRATVYNLLRGEMIVEFSSAPGKGIKLVPESTLRRICERNTKRYL